MEKKLKALGLPREGHEITSRPSGKRIAAISFQPLMQLSAACIQRRSELLTSRLF